jgi:soluble lytic murein transglycosylase-like protein
MRSSIHTNWLRSYFFGIAVLFGLLSVGIVSGQGRVAMDASVDLKVLSESEVVSNNGTVPKTQWDSSRVRVGRKGRGSKGRVLVEGYNSRLVAAVYRECARYRIDPRLVFSLIWQESGGKLHVVSPKGARGPLQLMPLTGVQFGARNPFDPDEAVKAGVAYLVSLLDQFGGNVSQALAAYNAGSVPVDAFLNGRTIVLRGGKVVNRRGLRRASGIPPYKETENYVENIANYYRRLCRETVVREGILQQ